MSGVAVGCDCIGIDCGRGSTTIVGAAGTGAAGEGCGTGICGTVVAGAGAAVVTETLAAEVSSPRPNCFGPLIADSAAGIPGVATGTAGFVGTVRIGAEMLWPIDALIASLKRIGDAAVGIGIDGIGARLATGAAGFSVLVGGPSTA